jgi:Ca-activated chloride channel family protein
MKLTTSIHFGGRLLAVVAAWTGLAVAAPAESMKLSVLAAKPVLPAGQTTITHLKVGLTGFDLSSDRARTPLNLAIVLDHSGSMSGEKLAHAKEAAQMTVQALRDDDIVSIVVYDGTIDVIVPATKATQRGEICARIAAVQAGSQTALFAGVSKGAEEARKFASKERVNRIVLLSDGLANVGPSSPGELAEVGASLAREGLSVTTIGLGAGYNEDLMTQLAARSDGRHAFIGRPAELAAIFRDELGMMMAVVAQKVTIEVTCDPGVKPVRVIGRPAVIAGGRVTLDLNQIYAGEERYAVLELEVPATGAGVTRDLARVEVRYENLYTKAAESLRGSVAARFSSSPEEVEQSINREAMAAMVTQIATTENERAMRLRDAGRKEEAKALLLSNGVWCRENGELLKNPGLIRYGDLNRDDAINLDKLDWGLARKQMRDAQYQNSVGQGMELEKATRRRLPAAADQGAPNRQ